MHGNKQAPEISISNNQMAQANGRVDSPLRNADARSEMPGEGKSTDARVGGAVTVTPSAGDQNTPADNSGDFADNPGSKIPVPAKTEQKPTIKPQQQAEIPQPGHETPSLTTNNLPPKGILEPVSDLSPFPQSKNHTSPQPHINGPSRANNKINLKSGETFDSHLFNVDVKSVEGALKDRQKKLIKDNDYRGQVILLGSPNSVHAWGEQDQGKLDGVLLAFYNDRIPKIYATYINGKSDGMLIKWNENGECVYGCQYKKGFRQGLCCYFKNNILRILFEINNNRYTAVHLCINSESIKSFDSIDEAAIDEDAKMFIGEVKTAESEIKGIENDYKSQIKKEVSKIQNKSIGELNQQRRQQTLEKMNQRHVEQQQADRAFRDKMGLP